MLSVNIKKTLGNFRLRVSFEAETGVTGKLENFEQNYFCSELPF